MHPDDARQIRRVALGRKNYLFAGSDSAAERIADAYTVLGTCHLHGVDPRAYLTDVIARLQGGWPQSRVDDLLPPQWNEARKGNRAGEHVDDQAEAFATGGPHGKNTGGPQGQLTVGP